VTVRDFTESDMEPAALAWLEALGYAIQSGPAIVPGELRMRDLERFLALGSRQDRVAPCRRL
jgi:hypothetical protein